MKKQGFAFLMVLCLLFSLCIFSNAEEATQDEEYEEESLILCEITWDAFEPGKVLVVLKKSEERKAPRFCFMPPGDRDVPGNTYRFPSYSEQSMFINRKI